MKNLRPLCEIKNIKWACLTLLLSIRMWRIRHVLNFHFHSYSINWFIYFQLFHFRSISNLNFSGVTSYSIVQYYYFHGLHKWFHDKFATCSIYVNTWGRRFEWTLSVLPSGRNNFVRIFFKGGHKNVVIFHYVDNGLLDCCNDAIVCNAVVFPSARRNIGENLSVPSARQGPSEQLSWM